MSGKDFSFQKIEIICLDSDEMLILWLSLGTVNFFFVESNTKDYILNWSSQDARV